MKPKKEDWAFDDLERQDRRRLRPHEKKVKHLTRDLTKKEQAWISSISDGENEYWKFRLICRYLDL